MDLEKKDHRAARRAARDAAREALRETTQRARPLFWHISLVGIEFTVLWVLALWTDRISLQQYVALVIITAAVIGCTGAVFNFLADGRTDRAHLDRVGKGLAVVGTALVIATSVLGFALLSL